jgi:RNA polymerase sigma-70 factor (ECF subfamily)
MRENTREMEAFLESVQRRAFRMALFSVGNTEDALDVVQDAMTALVRRYRNRPENELKMLFYRILRNKINDWHRRRAFRHRLRAWFAPKTNAADCGPADPLEQLPDTASTDPAAQVLLDDAVAAVHVAVSKLPLRQQQAFLLRAWEEMSVAETAAAMQCSQGSVKTHYARALHSLRQMLRDYRS